MVTVYIIFSVFSVFLIMYLLLKNSHLKFDNQYLRKAKIAAENSSSLYFNTLIQYREIIIRNNLTVPEQNQEDVKPTFTVDEILNEINEKGIDNISKDKLNFLNKQNGEKN